MNKDTERILKKAKRIFAAIDKGDRSRRRYTQLAKFQQELEALIPIDVPRFLKKTKT